MGRIITNKLRVFVNYKGTTLEALHGYALETMHAFQNFPNGKHHEDNPTSIEFSLRVLLEFPFYKNYFPSSSSSSSSSSLSRHGKINLRFLAADFPCQFASPLVNVAYPRPRKVS